MRKTNILLKKKINEILKILKKNLYQKSELKKIKEDLNKIEQSIRKLD